MRSLEEKRIANRTANRCWRIKHPEKVKTASKARYAKPGFKEYSIAKYKAFLVAHPGYSNAARQKSIRKKQERLAGRPKPKCCEACGKLNRQLCWDHCHKSKKFRGWICKACNWAIGNVNDSPKTLRKLADYLERCKYGGSGLKAPI
jgi:hypothetical protein